MTLDGPIILSQLWIYPIKSLGGVRMAHAAITPAGSLELDREWVVVDLAGNKLWQGDLPKMALTRLSLDAAAVTVAMPGMAPLRIARDHDGPACTVAMYKHRFVGVDAGETAAGWLSEAFGQDVRLVRVGPETHRRPGLNPVHVVSLASLAALNSALGERGEAPVEVERFRPNLVLDAAAALPAFFEEHYAGLRFGDAELSYRESCVRCELPNISRVDARRLRQPLKLIGGMSRGRPTTALAGFGVYSGLSGAPDIAEGARGAPLALRRVAAA